MEIWRIVMAGTVVNTNYEGRQRDWIEISLRPNRDACGGSASSPVGKARASLPSRGSINTPTHGPIACGSCTAPLANWGVVGDRVCRRDAVMRCDAMPWYCWRLPKVVAEEGASAQPTVERSAIFGRQTGITLMHRWLQRG